MIAMVTAAVNRADSTLIGVTTRFFRYQLRLMDRKRERVRAPENVLPTICPEKDVSLTQFLDTTVRLYFEK